MRLSIFSFLALLLSITSIIRTEAHASECNYGACSVNRAQHSCSPRPDLDQTVECICGNWELVESKVYGHICGNDRAVTAHYTWTYSTAISDYDHSCIPYVSHQWSYYAGEFRHDALANSCSNYNTNFHKECLIDSFTSEEWAVLREGYGYNSTPYRHEFCNQDDEILYCKNGAAKDLTQGPRKCESNCRNVGPDGEATEDWHDC